MASLRTLLCLVTAALAAYAGPAAAQFGSAAIDARKQLDSPPRGTWLPGGRSYLGLQLGRTQAATACMPTALLCTDTDRSSQLYAGTMVGKRWGVEVGYLNLGRVDGGFAESRAQGLNLSLVGKARLGPAVGVFGKLGTTYGRTENTPAATGILGAASEQGFGLSYGAGLSLEFTPRLSATLEWDSHDLRLPGGGRDPIRSTNLGLQFRY